MIEEGHRIKRQELDYIQTRMRYKQLFQTVILINPQDPRHFIKKDLIDTKIADYFYASPYDNPYLPPDYLKNQERLLTKQLQARLLFGEWIGLTGKVYSESFSFDHNIIKNIPDGVRPVLWFAGLDFGAGHFTAFVLKFLGNDGKIYTVGEYQDKGINIEMHAERIKALCELNGVNIANVQIFRDHDAQLAIEYKRYGINTRPAPKHNKLNNIAKKHIILQTRQELYLDGKTDKTVNCICNIEWEENRNGQTDEVKKTDDDLHDADLYATSGAFYIGIAKSKYL